MNIQDIQTTQGLMDFIKNSPTAFHAVHQIAGILEQAGYEELPESAPWVIEEGGQYYVKRNGSSLIAFRYPKVPQILPPFMIAASHSDSPSFKVKENPEIAGGGYIKLNVEKYGGMLMYPWFDRPLSVAGRIVVKDQNVFRTQLVDVGQNILMIPSLAVHMDRKANEGHALNAQKEMLPIMGLGDKVSDEESLSLMDMVGASAGVSPDAIAASDLFCYSTSEPTIWGREQEFVSAGRLDDLQCAFGSLLGFLTSKDVDNIPMYAIFDNEEVGSGTKQGADSTFLSDVLERIADVLGFTTETLRQSIASSFMVSCDNAHALHPNFPEKADPVNQPKINGGVVIKHSANQKYTTDAVSAAIFREICEQAEVPYQEFTNRSDMIGGSTLGNIANAHVSLNTVDIGLAQLAMHSPYETAGVKDTGYLVRAMQKFFETTVWTGADGEYTLG